MRGVEWFLASMAGESELSQGHKKARSSEKNPIPDVQEAVEGLTSDEYFTDLDVWVSWLFRFHLNLDPQFDGLEDRPENSMSGERPIVG